MLFAPSISSLRVSTLKLNEVAETQVETQDSLTPCNMKAGDNVEI